MPTSDPVKRRKQNCENQKRWRQRQIDEIHQLKTTLEEKERRVVELEAESDKLRTALFDALAEVDRVRKLNDTLKLRVQTFSRQIQSLSTDMDGIDSFQPYSLALPLEGRPMIEPRGADCSSIGMV